MDNFKTLVSLADSMDIATLADWYIASVGGEEPVWTDAHIEELVNDFYVIPKDVKMVETNTVKSGYWVRDELIDWDSDSQLKLPKCSNCLKDSPCMYDYCPHCGVPMKTK